MLRTLAALLLLSFAAPALAQEFVPLPESVQIDNGEPATSAVATAASAAFAAANEKMHRDMSIDYTGDPDIAFLRAMIAHHQGAIDLANVILEYGDDDEIARLAQEVIAEQTAKIARMREWLARRGSE
jgi:uncharacterized protein (DUF305 family)